MNYTLKAIERARQGGMKQIVTCPNDVLLTASFWECLSKAEEWSKETVSFQVKQTNIKGFAKGGVMKYTRKAHLMTRPRWRKDSRPHKYYMAMFMDHIAERKTIESFFKKILKK